MKLLRVERTINEYNNANKLVAEVLVDVPLVKLLTIVEPVEDDPELIDGYELSDDQVKKILDANSGHVELVCNKEHRYFLVCGGVYDWGAKVLRHS